MIKVFIEREAKEPERLLIPLRELRAAAMKQMGYISGETLVSAEDNSNLIIVSTWQSLKDWKNWEKAEERIRLEKKIKPFLAKPCTVKIYRYLSYPKRTTGRKVE